MPRFASLSPNWFKAAYSGWGRLDQRPLRDERERLRLSILVFVVALLAWFDAAPVEAQGASFRVTNRNHATRKVWLQANVALDFCLPRNTWEYKWGDGTVTDIGSTNIIAVYSHQYKNWGTYTITLNYQCHGRSARSTSLQITLTKPADPPTPTPTPVPLEVWFHALVYNNNNGLLYIETRSSIPGAEIICSFSGAVSGKSRCPSHTLISRSVSQCGTITVTANATAGAQKASASQDVGDPCSPTATPTSPPAGSANIAVASQDDPKKSVTAKITQKNCTGIDDWSVDWGDGQSSSVASPYVGEQSHKYPDWGAYNMVLGYHCQGGDKTSASAEVALVHPTPTVTPTPLRALRELFLTPERNVSSFAGGGGTPGPKPTHWLYPTQDHSCLPVGAEVISESPWISFCEVYGAAISNAAVREAALSAIDVVGPLGVDAVVCFAGAGSLLLLDTAYSPRRLIWLDSYLRADGKICGQLDRAGTIVLMPAEHGKRPFTPTPTVSPPIPTPNPYLIADSLNLMRPLENCMVSSVRILNFRARPAGQILSWYAGTSVALARTPNWFKVAYLGEEGWISSHLVTTEGDCG